MVCVPLSVQHAAMLFQRAIRYGVVSLWRQLSVTINECVTFRDNKTNSKEQSRGEFIIVHPIPRSSVLPTAQLRNSIAGVRAPTLRLKNLFKVYFSQWRIQEFLSGKGVFNKFNWGQRTERTGIWGLSPLVRGSGGSCNLVQEISFHIVKFS